ncbi:hypothetical protein HZ326_18345 [Fusarium oxysporum f. sp. albedinis]|nr:hypothetical protein HZ326_18345 [Fusarium oxysporum f. sp. albedinis]
MVQDQFRDKKYASVQSPIRHPLDWMSAYLIHIALSRVPNRNDTSSSAPLHIIDQQWKLAMKVRDTDISSSK